MYQFMISFYCSCKVVIQSVLIDIQALLSASDFKGLLIELLFEVIHHLRPADLLLSL